MGNGVIYFSLESQIDPFATPSQVFAALYRAFEQAPQQILWKCAKGREPPLSASNGRHSSLYCVRISFFFSSFFFLFLRGLNAKRSLSHKGHGERTLGPRGTTGRTREVLDNRVDVDWTRTTKRISSAYFDFCFLLSNAITKKLYKT